MTTYTVNFSTGAGNSGGFATIEEAKKYADDGICCTCKDILIETEPSALEMCRGYAPETVAQRSWEQTGKTEKGGVDFGSFGHYSAWIDL